MNKRYFIRIFPLIVLFAGSCTVGPKFKAPAVETPPRYMGAAGTAATDLYWWQLFDDTTLTRLIATAIENNRNVEIAFSRVEQARLTLKETRAGLWPSVSYGVTGQYGTESFIGLKSDKPVETYIIKPSISWELDLFGKIRRMSEADRAQLLATDRAAQGVLVSLVAEVASTYFSYLQYEYAGKTARQTSISREATYALQQQSYAIGSIDELQLRQGEAAYATAAAANAQYERASEQALHALSLLLGQNPSQVVGKHTPLVDLRIPAEVPAGLPSDLLARRPDMVEAYYQVMAANAQIGVAQAMRFPSIALTGNGGVFSEEFKKLFDHNAWMWSAAGGITGPVFNFGANKRRVQIMREKHREAIMNYEQCFLQALREVEDALTAVRTYRTQLESMLTLVTAAEKADRLSQQQYAAGQISYLDVLETQRTLFDAQSDYAETLSATMSSYATLYKALGGGIMSPEESAEKSAATQ